MAHILVEIQDLPEYPVTNNWLLVRYDKISQTLRFIQSFASEDTAKEACKAVYNGLVVRNTLSN